MLSGYRVDIYLLVEYIEFECIVEANDFLLVYVEQEWRSDSLCWVWWIDWDWVKCLKDNFDLFFLFDLVDVVVIGWNVDCCRVYVVGYFCGGVMFFIVVLEQSDLFVVVCFQLGFMEFGYDVYVKGWSGVWRILVMLVYGMFDSDVVVLVSDVMNSFFKFFGWIEFEFVYYWFDNVVYWWQFWMNQIVWDFLSVYVFFSEVLS